MTYHMHIRDARPVQSYSHSINSDTYLVVGNEYKVHYNKPKNKKERINNNRIVELLGFSGDFMADPIVRYKDTGRRGRVDIGSLIPTASEKLKNTISERRPFHE